MKVSALVESLQKLQSKHGDVTVGLETLRTFGGYSQTGVDNVYFRDGEIVIEGDEDLVK